MSPRSRPSVRRVLGVAVALAIVGAGLAVSVPAPASAAVPSGFDPADIIDDATMFDGSTMDAAAVQRFLDAEQPTCAPGATCLKSVTVDVPALAANPMCRAVRAATAQTAAQVIATVGSACDVNPRVILVMLQKEQTLVTGRMPYGSETVASIYGKATGLGCPDTAACDPAKYGLFNQLYGVAYWLVRYTMPPGTGPGTAYSSIYNWFPVGRPSTVSYSPTSTCGGTVLTIRNAATASLYYYTPYQPDAAALAAGWGLGDSCSAYGNRNFFLYFTTWFGSTHTATPTPSPTVDPATAAATAITAAWTAAGGAGGALGAPAGAVTAVTAAVPGWVQQYAGGAVYTSRAGTVALQGAAATKYAAVGGPGGALGWPTAPTATGATFQHGVVVTTPTGAWVVAGALQTAWARTASLGAPIGDAGGDDSGAYQDFVGGRLVVTPSVTTVVQGPVLARWVALQGGAGVLGWPTGGATTRNGVLTQPFQHGVIVSRAGSVLGVGGPVFADWMLHGGGAGPLGWPRAAASTSASGSAQRFTGGTVYWTARSGAHPLTGAVLQAYDRQGGTTGALGWPGVTTRDRAGRGGSMTVFTAGRIYASSRGAFPVPAKLVAVYLAKGGPARLGWPTGLAATAKGRTTQRFEHGSLSVSAR